MKMEIKKELVQFNRKKCNSLINTGVETDIIIPDTKEDVKEIVNVDSYVQVTGSELQNDRILIYGTVSYNIVYLADSEENVLRHVSTDTKFTDVSDIKGVTNEDANSVFSDVKQTEVKILNGRKLSLKSNIETNVSVFEKVETELASVSQEIEGFEQITEYIDVLSFNPPVLKEIELNEKVSIPLSEQGANEILRINAVISDTNTKIINGKIIVKGEIVLSTLYETSATKEIKTLNNTVGFTEILDVSGISEKSDSDIKFDISYLKFSPYENSESEIRGADVTIGLSGNVNYYENKTVSMIKDCYCTDKIAKPVVEKMTLAGVIENVDNQLTLKDTVTLNAEAPEIRQILSVDSKAFITGIENKENSVVVKGSVDTYLMYMTDGEASPLYSAAKTTDFEQSFEAKECENCDSQIAVNTLSSSYAFRDSKSADIRCNIEIKGVITGVKTKDVVKDIEFNEFDENSKNFPTFTVYFAQKNDKLWDIAKKYFTTVKEIKAMNEMETDEIKEGSKLFIPKCKS